MPEIKIQHVVSYSSQDVNNPAENLLKADGSHKWKCAKVGEKQSTVVLQFEKASVIHSIDIGNDSSAFVEVLVGRSSSEKDFQVILVASSFMSPLDSRNNTNKYSVRMFGGDKLSKTASDEKWDRVKIVCTQPFNKNITYGLSFIKFHSPPEKSTASTTNSAEINDDLVNPKKIGAFFFRRDEEENDVKVGSLFARHKEKAESPPLTVAGSIRDASNEARAKYAEKKNNDSSSHTPTTSGVKNKRKHDLSDDEDGVDEKKGKYNRNAENSTSRPKDEDKSSHRHKEEHEKSKHNREKEEKKEKKSSHRDDGKSRESNNHHNNSATSKSQSLKVQESSKANKPFHKILDGVVFVLSGFQNPFRADIRDKAIEMGAKYRPDWMDGCTHLVCAFANTPKYAQVKGKGRIVTKHWILDCYKQKTMLYWKKYRLIDNELSKEGSADEDKPKKSSPDSSQKTESTEKKQSDPDPEFVPSKQDEDKSDEEESEDDTDDEVRRVKEAESKKKATKPIPESVPSSSSFGGSTIPLDEEIKEGDDEYDIATDVDEDDSGSDGELPELPDFLAKKHFFLYGALSEKERHNLTRYIIAYNGELEDYMNEKVDFVITAERWDDNFDEALNNFPQLTFVRPRWLYKCNDSSKWVPYQPHIVIP